MFGKKRRAMSSPPQRVPANPSAPASLAATKAFARDRETTVSLSNAAAAQALRTHVITPTPVGDTVTRRMARRNSTSSNGSSARPPSTTLRRQSSSGSMTERSFRAASPARGNPAEPSAPPVPPVPQNIPDGGVHRRASSLEPALRVASPAPRGTGRGRGASVDSGARTAPARTQALTSGLANVAEEDGNQRSVNFSRPMSPGLSISKHSTPFQTGTSWFSGPVVDEKAVRRTSSPASSRPKSSGGLSGFEAYRTHQSTENAADRPVKKNHVSYAVQGAQLSSGSMRAKPAGTAIQSRSFLGPVMRQPPRTVDPNSPDAVYDPSSRTFIHKQDAMALHRELHEEFKVPEEPTQQYVSQHIDSYRPQQRSLQRSPAPVRQSMQHDASPASQRSRDIFPLQPDTSMNSHPSHALEPRIDLISDQSYYDDIADANTKPKNIVEDASAVPIVNHISPKFAPAQDPGPIIPTPTNTIVSQNHGGARTVHDSHSSLSPPRNAHFAPVAVELAGEKHKPPPRSSSPAKSALKSSPAVSRRGSSPVAPAGRLFEKGASSEVSDTLSDDGMKKRRSMRVSFEETPILAGTSAYVGAQTPATPAGLGASKWSPVAEKENAFEDLMKPRAALPVFGSIRDKERRSSPESIAEKVIETVSSTPMTTSVGSIVEPLHSSNDHALGNIVAQDFARKQSQLEESGYVSDSSQESNSHKHGDAQPSFVPEPKPLIKPMDEKSSTPGSIGERVVDVPNIALLPPTPSPHEGSGPIYSSTTIPGGLDEEVHKQGIQAVETASRRADKASPIAPIQTNYQQSPVRNEEDDSSDQGSVYSDAYEDLTDTEGGFASIDAMVESPLVLSSPGLNSSRHADKGATDSASKIGDETSVSNDAEPVTSRKQLNVERNARVVQAPVAQEETKEARKSAPKPLTKIVTPVQAPQTSAKPLKSAMKKTAPAQSVQSAEPHLRKSMRGESVPVTRAQPSMRSSMRGPLDTTLQAQPQMRRSMRESEPARPTSPGLAASRHSMIQLETKPPRGALQKRHIPKSEPIPNPRPLSMPVGRQMAVPAPTYDSDSDGSASSFQRTRARASRNQGGRYTMRGSMRNNPAPNMRSNATAPTQTPIRAISPPGSPSPAMRKSMRPSSPTQEAPKSSKFRLRSLSPIGRFRSSKSPERETPSPKQSKKTTMPAFSEQVKQKSSTVARAGAPKASLNSRFADSSDEDEDEPPRHFQSRFADSDSDDGDIYKLPPGLAPVRGIPRRVGEEDGDSTDLEEEGDHEKGVTPAQPIINSGPSTNSAGKGQANGIANGKTGFLSGGSLRDSKHAPTLPSFEAGDKAKSKRGFLGLGKKKTSPNQLEAAPPTMASEANVPVPPSQRNRQLGLALTPIEEDKDFGLAVPDSPEAAKVKKAPKLNRRSTPEWPLPSPIGVGVVERPMSSDGIAPRRPRFQMRQPSTMSNITAPVGDSNGRTVSFGRDGKKKKFQGLRRVFGLND